MSKYKAEQHITLDSKEFLKEAEKVKKANEEMGKSAEQASSNASEKVDKYTQKLNKLTETLEQLRKEQQKYEEGSIQFDYYSKEIEKATNALDKHLGKTKELKDAIEELSILQQQSNHMVVTDADISSVAKQYEQLGESLRKLTDEQKMYEQGSGFYEELERRISLIKEKMDALDGSTKNIVETMNQFEKQEDMLVSNVESLSMLLGTLDQGTAIYRNCEEALKKAKIALEDFYNVGLEQPQIFDVEMVNNLDEYSSRLEQLKSRIEELRDEQSLWTQDSAGWKFYQSNIAETQKKIDELEGSYRGLNSTVNEYFESMSMKETILNDVFKIDEYSLKVEQLKNKIAELREQQSLYESHQSGYEYYAKEIEEYTKRYEELVELKKKDNEISQNVQTATRGISLGFSEMSAIIVATYSALKKLYESLEEYARIANESQRQTIALAIAIRNSGDGIEPTFRRLSSLIDEIDKKSLFSDKDITQAVAYMEAIQTLNDDALERAVKISADLATIMGDNLPNTARTLSRALTDPTNATFAFQRAGVKLSQETVRLAKDFMAEGNQAEAVNVMLKELEDRYAGVAESVASLDTSVFEKIAKDTKDIKENLGEIFTNIANGALQPILNIIEKVEAFTTWLKNQSSSNTLLDKVYNSDITAEQIVTLYGPDAIKSAYENSYSVRLHREENAWLNDPNHRGRTVNDMFLQDWWKQLNSLAQEETELVKAMILLNTSNPSKSLGGNGGTSSTQKDDTNSYAYKLAKLREEEANAEKAYSNAQTESERTFEYQRLLDARRDVETFTLYGVDYKTWQSQQDKAQKELETSQINDLKNRLEEYKYASKDATSTEMTELLTQWFGDIDVDTLTEKAFKEYTDIIRDATYNIRKLAENEVEDDLRNKYFDFNIDSYGKDSYGLELLKAQYFGNINVEELSGDVLEEYEKIIKEIDLKIQKARDSEFKEALKQAYSDFDMQSYWVSSEDMFSLMDVLFGDFDVEQMSEEQKDLYTDYLKRVSQKIAKARESENKNALNDFKTSVKNMKKDMEKELENIYKETKKGTLLVGDFFSYKDAVDGLTNSMQTFYNTIKSGKGVLEGFKNAFFNVVDQIIEKLIALIAVEAVSRIFGVDASSVATASTMATKFNAEASSGFTFDASKYATRTSGNIINVNMQGISTGTPAEFGKAMVDSLSTSNFLLGGN